VRERFLLQASTGQMRVEIFEAPMAAAPSRARCSTASSQVWPETKTFMRSGCRWTYTKLTLHFWHEKGFIRRSGCRWAYSGLDPELGGRKVSFAAAVVDGHTLPPEVPLQEEFFTHGSTPDEVTRHFFACFCNIGSETAFCFNLTRMLAISHTRILMLLVCSTRKPLRHDSAAGRL